MATLVITTVSEARAAANEWLIAHLPDRFAAGIPDYDQTRRVGVSPYGYPMHN
jgi:hypothetical protein